MDSICQANEELVNLGLWKHASTQVPYIPERECHDRTYPILFPNPSTVDSEMYIMTSCVHNDIVGLRNRYLRDNPNGFTADVTIIEKIVDELADKLRPHYNGKLSLHEFLDQKKGKLRRRYEDSARKVYENGFNVERHCDIQAFIKNEIYSEKKPPRMIMGRDPRFNLIYGLFTTALEHAMVHLPEVSKGRNFKDRGKQFFKKIFGATIAEVDFSKYESTQRLQILSLVELGLARRLMCDGDYEVFRQCFITKMRKRGTTVNGTKFEFWYCRGSGDMDTGLFNTLITWVACRYFELINKTGHFNFICDGDDNLMKIPVGHPELVDTFAHFGFEAKLKLVGDYHDAEYCSGKFVQYAPGKFYYVQNLNKLMEQIRVFRKPQFNHCKGTYYHSLGYMYRVLYPNFPLYSSIAGFLMRIAPRRHVSTTMLNEINPSHCEAFQGSKDLELEFNRDVLEVELGMCFNMTSGEISRLSEWYDAKHVTISHDEDKRYNNTSTPAVLLTPFEQDVVEQLMETTMRRHKFSRTFQTRVIQHLR